MAAMTFADPGIVPAVATDTVLVALGAEVGDTVQLDLDGAPVLSIEREVPYLPGMPRGPGLLVDRDLLGRAALQLAWSDPLLDEWWLQVPDEDAADVVRQVEAVELGAATSPRRGAVGGDRGPAARRRAGGPVGHAFRRAGAGRGRVRHERDRRGPDATPRARAAAGARRVPPVPGAAVRSSTSFSARSGSPPACPRRRAARVIAPLVTVSAVGGQPVPAVVVHWPWATELVLVTLLVVLVGPRSP